MSLSALGAARADGDVKVQVETRSPHRLLVRRAFKLSRDAPFRRTTSRRPRRWAPPEPPLPWDGERAADTFVLHARN